MKVDEWYEGIRLFTTLSINLIMAQHKPQPDDATSDLVRILADLNCCREMHVRGDSVDITLKDNTSSSFILGRLPAWVKTNRLSGETPPDIELRVDERLYNCAE